MKFLEKTELVRPSVGEWVELYPNCGGDRTKNYKIKEWEGNKAIMTNGEAFRWHPDAGFLL